MGVSLGTYRRHINPQGTCGDLKRITWETAAGIYEREYWRAVRGDELPVGLDLMLFDMAVNAGPATAVKLLQRLLNAEVDGFLGNETLSALARRDPARLIEDYHVSRMTYYRGLKTWPVFGEGWEKRAEVTMLAALDMAEKKTPARSP